MLAQELDDLRAEAEETALEPDDREHLDALLALEETLGDLHVAENHGVSLIVERDFKQYAIDMAEDMGLKIDGWPYDAIDWHDAAEELKMDYTVIEFDGETYYTRDV
jgi:hypothetical protein